MVVGTEDDLQFVLVYTVKDCVKASLGVIQVICASIPTSEHSFPSIQPMNDFLTNRLLSDVVWNFGHSIQMQHQKLP